MAEIEAGKRYSFLYVDKEPMVKDSVKARYRISKVADYCFPPAKFSQKKGGYDPKKHLTDIIQQEVGVRFSTSIGGSSYESWELFFKKISLIELLDTITVIISPIYDSEYDEEDLFDFRDRVRRIFREENLAFTIDDKGGIHPLVDTVFTQMTSSAIAGLEGPRYKYTYENIEEIDMRLLQDPPDYIGAIRLVFGACENLFKLMYRGNRLDSRSASEKISATQQRLYSDHPTMLSSSAKLLNGFKEWIDAAHFYRHEEGREERVQPQEELAILLISEGLSYVRWLAAIDRKLSDLTTPSRST